MREQYEEAITILTDIVNNYIWDMEDVDGECEEKEEIMEALELVSKLAEKSVDWDTERAYNDWVS